MQDEAGRWLRRALHLAAPVVVSSRSTTPPRTAELAARPVGDWLRTYVGHGRGGDPLERLGQQDITADVCHRPAGARRAPAPSRSQADLLRAHGIDDLVAEGRRIWTERAARGRPRGAAGPQPGERGRALLDPSGLGAFTVLEWSS